MILDMSPTSVGRFIATALATGWLITSSVKQDSPGVSDSSASGARPTAAETVPTVKFTGRLSDPMRETPAPQRGRNPFVYGARLSIPRDGVPAAAEPVAMTPALPVEPPQPVFKLSGIAASQRDGIDCSHRDRDRQRRDGLCQGRRQAVERLFRGERRRRVDHARRRRRCYADTASPVGAGLSCRP